ncbi:MAG: hypothetical protein GX654_19065 [Desulfatiglans sp.]|jgi:hypothetical protein|nr:hypothetical protein [Desulfatiglans sp.]
MTKKNQKDKKNQDQEWPLPFCTKAPSAEHHRSADNDEPCDDARATEFEEEKENMGKDR